MPKKLKVQISVQSLYQFEMEVPDDYNKSEAYMLASDYFESWEDTKDFLVDSDFQVDTVEEVADEPLKPRLDFVNNRGE